MNIGVKIIIIIIIAILIVALLLAFIPSLFKSNATKVKSQTTSGTGNLFKSTDGGATWQELATFPGGEVRKIVIDKNDPKALLVGTEQGGIWRSNDGGTSWEEFRESLGTGSRIYDIIEPAASTNFISLAYFQNRGRVIRFSSGQMQELLFTPLENFAYFRGYYGNLGLIRVIGSDGGLYESRNSGSSWRATSRFKDGLNLFETNRNNSSEIWASSSKGSLFYTNDGGMTWQDISAGLGKFPKSNDVKIILYDPDSGALYHGSSYGLLVSYDIGITFQEVGLIVPPEALPVASVALLPNAPSRLIVGLNGIVFISSDSGDTWTGRKIPGNGSISSIAIDPKNAQTIYVGFEPASRF